MKRLIKLVSVGCLLLLFLSAFLISADNMLVGDVDGDGDVDADDASLVFGYVSGYGFLSYDQLDIADVDGDGGVTVADAAQILHKAEGTLGSLPFVSPGEGHMTLISLPTKTEYTEGEQLDLTGLSLGTVYLNGDVEYITDFTCSGYDPTPGIKVVTVSSGSFRASFAVTVFPTEIVRLEITSLPSKTTYAAGEELDLTGLVVKAVRSDGSSYVVDSYTVDGFEPTAGQHEITVKYRLNTASFAVDVN